MNHKDFRTGMIAGGVGALVLAVGFSLFGNSDDDRDRSYDRGSDVWSEDDNDWDDRDKKQFSGDMITKDLDLPAFTSIRVKGAIQLEVAVGESQEVVLEATDEWLDRILMEVDEDELVIDMKTRKRGFNFESDNSPTVTIKMPSLTGFRVDGAVDADIANVDAESFDFEMRGAGDIDISGSCKSLEVDVRGAGDINLEDLKCGAVKVELKGVGDVSVYASDSINAVLAGMGNIDVYGGPKKVNKRVGGFGTIDIN